MKSPWERLLQILEEERKAIIAGNIEELLECVRRKEELLKEPALKNTPLSPKVKERIDFLLKHNQQLLQTGLAFIEEAYRFLGKNLSSKTVYTSRGAIKEGVGGQLLNLEA